MTLVGWQEPAEVGGWCGIPGVHLLPGDLPSLPRCLGVEDNFFFLWGFHIICPYPDAVDPWCCSGELMKISPPCFSLSRKRFAYVFSCFCVYPFFP